MKTISRGLYNQENVSAKPGFKARAPDSKTQATKSTPGWIPPAIALPCRRGKAVAKKQFPLISLLLEEERYI